MAELRGDRQTQCDVLVALSECRNHRRWFAGFARPYLGDHPIEIGSGLGDYAREWIPLVKRFAATDADEAMVVGLKRELAGLPHVDVRQIWLPTTAAAEHSCLISYNVLEHIEDDVGALRSMARPDPARRLHRPGLPGVPVRDEPGRHRDRAVRRYTKRTMRTALTAAGLEVVDLKYANSLGLICYYAFTSLLRRQPSTGGTMIFYDRVVVPVYVGARAADQAAALRPVRGCGRAGLSPDYPALAEAGR